MAKLCLLRHGLSQWNRENKFTGWTDVALDPRGETDAKTASKYIEDTIWDIAWTSRLMRAKRTMEIILKGIHREMPIECDSALNERHYGDLQGLNKADTIQKYGEEQVRLWRRSYSVRPPNGESVEDCKMRVIPFFRQYILPELEKGKNVLIAAHGNSLRPIMQLLRKLSDDETAVMEIALTTPYIFEIENGEVKSFEERKVPGIVLRIDQATGQEVLA